MDEREYRKRVSDVFVTFELRDVQHVALDDTGGIRPARYQFRNAMNANANDGTASPGCPYGGMHKVRERLKG